MSSKQEIIKQNIAFMYGRDENHKKYDPDKRTFIKTKIHIDPDAISNFVDAFECLDPSYPCAVCIPGEEQSPYPSFEHALQAIKFPNNNVRSLIRNCETVKDAKKIVSKSNEYINTNWKDTIIVNAEKLLRDKFIRNKSLRAALLSTKKKEIIFANDYGDQYWGVTRPEGKGQNNLGKLLQKIRSEVDRGDDLPQWISSTISLYDEMKLSVSVVVEKDGIQVNDDCKVITCRNKLMIGKDEEMCDVIAAHPTVSRVHLVFVVDSKRGPMILDLNSANGTTIDGNSVSAFAPTPITSDLSVIRLGASSRVYKFKVDMNYHLIKREMLYDKMSDPNIQKLKDSDKKELTAFVSNLPFECLEADVYNFFSSCGNISSLTVPLNKGIAFLVMENMSGFIQALSRNGEILLGRPIKVKKSEVNDKDKRNPKSETSYYQKQKNENDLYTDTKNRSRSNSRERRGGYRSRSSSVDSRRQTRRDRSRSRDRRPRSRDRSRSRDRLRSRDRSRSRDRRF